MILELECKKPLREISIPTDFEEEVEARVELEEVGKYRYIIELPEELLGGDLLLPSIYYAVESLLEHLPPICEVKSVEFPLDRVRSPTPGKSGLKKYLGLRGPGVAASVGKNVVLHPLSHARLFREMCKAGLHVGFDPLSLMDKEASPYLDRAHQIVEIIDRIKEEEGKRVLYFMRLPTSSEDLERAISLGMRGFYVHMCWDLGRLELAIEFLDDIFLAARSVNCLSREAGLGIKATYELLRVSGFDLIERPVAWKREDLEIVRELDEIIGGGKGAAMPLTAPQVHQGIAIANVPEDLQVILNGDLGIYDHPRGIIAGVRSMREVLDSFMRGENPLSVIRRDKDVEAMVEKWGYLLP